MHRLFEVDMQRYISLLVAALVSLVTPCFVCGGDCLDSLEEDLEFLEQTKYSESTARPIYYRLFCIRADFRTDTNRWAGPIAAAYIKTCRENPLRERICATCKTYLGDREGLRYEAARTMAHYAIGTADGEDIYTILISHRDDPPWFDLAVLGDPRTVSYIRELYSLRRPIGVENSANLEAMIAMLNCLYHIPDNSALGLAQELLAAETESVLSERLNVVLNRPEIGRPARLPFSIEIRIASDVVKIGETPEAVISINNRTSDSFRIPRLDVLPGRYAHWRLIGPTGHAAEDCCEYLSDFEGGIDDTILLEPGDVQSLRVPIPGLHEPGAWTLTWNLLTPEYSEYSDMVYGFATSHPIRVEVVE